MASRAVDRLWSRPKRRRTTGNWEGFSEHHSAIRLGRNGAGAGTGGTGQGHAPQQPMSSTGSPANAPVLAARGSWGTPDGLTAVPLRNPAGGEFRHPSVRRPGIKCFQKNGGVTSGSVQEGMNTPHAAGAAPGRP